MDKEIRIGGETCIAGDYKETVDSNGNLRFSFFVKERKEPSAPEDASINTEENQP